MAFNENRESTRQRLESLEKTVQSLAEGLEVLRHEIEYGEIRAQREAARDDETIKSLVTAQTRWVRPTTTDGWIRAVTSSGNTISLPSSLEASHTSTTGGRDSFKILEGLNRGLDASMVSGNLVTADPHEDGAAMTFQPRPGGPVVIDGVSYDSEVAIRSDGAAQGPFAAKTDASNPVAQGTHVLEIPDFPHPGGAQYGDFGTVWFRIGTSGDRYVHPGRVSAGCVTCAPRYWVEIYRALVNARKGDLKSVGDLTVT